MGIRFPNETAEYRAARNRLLQPELELRRQMEEVAAELRRLPNGGEVPEDYVFQRMGAGGAPEAVRMSELFRGRDTSPATPRTSDPDRQPARWLPFPLPTARAPPALP
jgi:predicted dithiol-disulfide oxidoreductase (DUF899 family)